MKNRKLFLPDLCGFVCIILMLSQAAFSQEAEPFYSNENNPTNVYWGDTHLHSNLSVDSFTQGLNVSPDDAYLFAKGGAVTREDGQTMRLHRPLDFLVVADHAENMGLMTAFETGFPLEGASDTAKTWYEQFQALIPQLKYSRMNRADMEVALWGLKALGEGPVGGNSFQRSMWESVAKRADKYNDPGKFTAFN